MNRKIKVYISTQVGDVDFRFENSIINQLTDPLFNSDSWKNAWWSRWGSDLELVTTTINSDTVPVCKIQLYIDTFKLKNTILTKRLQFIGTNYQNITTPRAEYLAFLVAKDSEGYLLEGLAALESVKWNEFVARDIVKGGPTDVAITQWAKSNRWLTRIIHTDTAYSINTTTPFEEYKKNLGSSTRLKLLNRRKLLETIGDVKIENYFPDKISEFFNLLNVFHQKRWGDTFSEKTLSFHKDIISSSSTGNLQVELSVLSVNGVCESVMFNYILDGRVYNINSGFNENFHKKIAIGILHFGYLIEAAFNSPDVRVFDFLAGQGKNSNYKSKLATDSIELYSLQIIRSRWLSTLYVLKGALDKVKKSALILSNFIFKWVK